MLGSQNASFMARRGLLVSTRAVVLHTTLRSSAAGPDTQQALVALALPLWPLHLTVLHHLKSILLYFLFPGCSSSLQQRGKSVLASLECSVTLSLREALKAD